MSKIYNVYENDLDKAWFDSSNIVYAECDDKTNSLKTVRITFKDGTTYEYKNVNATDYLLFRESTSNGKAFLKYIKKYECEKIGKLDVDELKKEINEIIEELNQNTENNEQN